MIWHVAGMIPSGEVAIRSRISGRDILMAGLMTLAACLPAAAEEGWSPFQDKDRAAPSRTTRGADTGAPPLAPMGGVVPGAAPTGFGAAYPGTQPPPDYARPLPGTPQPMASSKVERIDLDSGLGSNEPPPQLAARPAGAMISGMPPDAWRGLDVAAIEETFATLPMPPKSPVMHGLWRRLLSASADLPPGGRTAGHFEAVRLEALYRSGLTGAMARRLEDVPAGDPVFDAFALRRDLALGDKAAVCRTARGLMSRRGELPKALNGELQLLSGYCAAVEGNTGAVGMAVELARESGVDAPVALAALDALAGNGKGVLTPPKLVHVLDYRLLELLGPIAPTEIIDRAEPALLVALAQQADAEPAMRVAAAEAAARINAISGRQLAAIYAAVPAGADDAGMRRAELVRVMGAEAVPGRKLQMMRVAMEDARKAGFGVAMAQVLAPSLVGVERSPEAQSHAETLIEIALLADDTPRARALATMSTTGRHWLPLIDLAEATPGEMQREQNLMGLDDLVRRGRFSSDVLHRLATVLDATDVNVPIPLWETASRAPQPASGYLPETGVLAQLQDAAKKKQIARTILLAMRALGPGGADGAHIIALGDCIRALRQVGLDGEARKLAVEALIAQWPRGGGA